MIDLCIAGATGWIGRALVPAVMAADDLTLKFAVSRSAAGKELEGVPGVPVRASVEEALDGVDVLVDYTAHDVVKQHTMLALERGIHVVIGSSGLTSADFEEIESAASANNVGVIAAGNFSLTAALAQAATSLVAPFLPQAEVIDYASSMKADVPSGTARELAERLAAARRPMKDRELADTSGPIEARGASVQGVQVHSLRLPSFSVSTEVVFGLPHERLTIRHDADSSPDPYVDGTLLAIRKVESRIGLTRGLDTLILAT